MSSVWGPSGRPQSTRLTAAPTAGRGIPRPAADKGRRPPCVRRLPMRVSLALTLTALTLALSGSAAAQEPEVKPLPPDAAAAIAKLLAADLAEIADELTRAPLAMAPDVDRASGLFWPE